MLDVLLQCDQPSPKYNIFINIAADPNEQQDLYNKYPKLVEKLRSKIEDFKRRRVESIIRPPIGISPLTTRSLGEVVVPRVGYCNPTIDSVLRPHNALCDK